MRTRGLSLAASPGTHVNFVANLRSNTIEAFAQENIQPSAYLLSTHRLSPATLEHAHRLRDEGVPLFADNGTKLLIDQVVSNFDRAAKSITNEIRRIRRQVGRTPRGKDVPLELRKRALELGQQVVSDCTKLSEQISSNELLDLQLSMRPTHLIAQEDFATACLLSLNLERETTGLSTEFFQRRNKRSLRLFDKMASDPRCRDIKVYAVLSAMDYNTARDAGALAAQHGARRVAVGMAGITRDATAIEFFAIDRRITMLEVSAPRRYVRLAQILRGIADGYRAAGKRLNGFHALGLGAATLFPVVAAAFAPETDLSVDATSPIRDAVFDDVLYDDERDADRLTRVAIVTRILRGQDWSFLCPFCQGFRERRGHSADRAIRFWEEAGMPEISPKLLDTTARLAEAIPLFAHGPEVPQQEIEEVYVAHNHFVLDQFAQSILDGNDRRARAISKIKELQKIESMTTSLGLRAASFVLETPISL